MIVRRFREVLERARLEPGQRVLDLGCGWAYGTLWAGQSGARAVGIDLELDQLAWARAGLDSGRSLTLAQADAARLPFRDATFDRVFSVEMMEHVFRPDRPRVLSEIARVLKHGGQAALAFTVHSRQRREGVPELVAAAGFGDCRVVESDQAFCVIAHHR